MICPICQFSVPTDGFHPESDHMHRISSYDIVYSATNNKPLTYLFSNDFKSLHFAKPYIIMNGFAKLDLPRIEKLLLLV